MSPHDGARSILGWNNLLTVCSAVAQEGQIAAFALGEIPLELWLIVMGVNAQRWMEQASAAGEWRTQRVRERRQGD